MDVSGDYGFLLPAYVLSDFLGFPKEDRDRVLKWSVDFIGFLTSCRLRSRRPARW